MSAFPGCELIELLRQGNDLEVYDAWSEQRACRVVVKALRPDRLDDVHARRRLLEEGRLLCALTHPHLVRAYEVHDGRHPFVVLETLSGETLGHMIDEREVELSVEQVAHLGLHLGSAIRYLHAHGYLHLDLKPSNVIAEAGRAKVIDLSVARPPGPAPPGVGTTYYMAPEQVRGGHLGPAADVWGIGAVLYEAATGEPAFDGAQDDSGYGTLAEFDHPQITDPPVPLAERRAAVAVLGPLVSACLERDPTRRPAVDQLLAELEMLAGLPPSERRHREKALTGSA